jgi:hypothetical protein
LRDPEVSLVLEPDVLDPLREQLRLLDGAGEALDMEAVGRAKRVPSSSAARSRT